ncbi:ATP-grasp domain-containing protein [Halorussus salilacus]|uniref:carboxylate--amine ligase n=1 Tax=Halorussus salilacus TaxID=2953750 RepID=UPI0020A1DFC2|nr:ATP-grasp domain-containing protein [Halorussus salilacus]USZ67828.1 ATP-grasp domain-containing protein [Halorussus salilacus]
MSGDTNPASAARGVVVPIIDAASSVACLRSLGRRGVPTVAISEDPAMPGLGSKYCTERVTTPDPAVDLDAYAEALLSLADRDDVRTVVPVREEDVYVLARHREAFAERVGTPWPDLDTLRSVQDRVELFDAARTAGVAAPETATVDEWTDWDREVIVKPRYTVHAEEYLDVAESHGQSHSTTFVAPGETPDRDELVAEMGHVPLVQEYVPDSDEYGFFALYDEGEAVATFQHRQRRGYKYSGGPSAYRESVDIPELDAAGRALLDELDWHGLAMVEFLRNPETGQFELMEVNPRFWTSLPFTVRAGVDFPYYYWRQAAGHTLDAEPEYAVGIAGHLLRGELLYLHSILFEDYPLVERPSFLRGLADVVTSTARHPRFDYLDADDPKPFVRDLRNVVVGASKEWRMEWPAWKLVGE